MTIKNSKSKKFKMTLRMLKTACKETTLYLHSMDNTLA